jgi:serine phosphatase RsbU (regulator of sigma subunit)
MLHLLFKFLKKGKENYIRNWKEQNNFEKYAGIAFFSLVALGIFFAPREIRDSFAKYLNIIAMCFMAIMLYSIKRTRRELIKKNKEIELQKQLIEESHKEITDSINYAERIQRSFIATKETLDENLNDYFVLFKPKDVVSGDFYWADKLNNGNFALATADSTGHGVPGAIMSLLNITSLEKAIEINIQPSDILNATRKTIIERLKKDGSSEGGKDGMDASLTVYDFKNKKLIIAAANNPVWIVRGTETIEIKADKMPVGKHDRDTTSFTQQEIDLQTGDVVYTLTDGFADQFGGVQGKKFMSKKLRELLSTNAHLPMQKQKELLDIIFKNWVGNLEQVDDVTLIGVRV